MHEFVCAAQARPASCVFHDLVTHARFQITTVCLSLSISLKNHLGQFVGMRVSDQTIIIVRRISESDVSQLKSQLNIAIMLVVSNSILPNLHVDSFVFKRSVRYIRIMKSAITYFYVKNIKMVVSKC